MHLSLHVGLCSLLALSVATPGYAQKNLFRNAGFEELDADGRPAQWKPIDFGTGGTVDIGDDGGKTGDHYVILRATEEKNRSCWQQGTLWEAQDGAVTVTGWYRTVGVAAGRGKGASIRSCFNDQPGVWHHLDLKTAWYPPTEGWTEITTTLLVPEGTREIFVQLFHWYTPGETHWDDVAVRPATEAEVADMALDPSIAVDREPTLGRSLPYSPADGETVRLNPPPFRWLPSGKTATYRLQIARTDAFDGDLEVDLSGSPWCCEMLTEAFEPGTWYWRYGVDGLLPKTVWSRARRFEVTEDVSPWAYPGREALRVPEGRPRLFLTRDRLAEYQQRAREGDLKASTDRLVRVCTKYAGKELVPEPDFLPKGEARRNAYTLIFRETRPPMDRMEQIALAYVLTGDQECAAEAKRRVLHFFSWDPTGSTGVFHNDEPAMWVMMRGVRAYDWTYDLYTPEEREAIEASMRARAAGFYEKLRSMPFENNPFESHAGRIIGFLGEAALEFLDEWPEATEWLDYITKIYWGVYPAWGKDDGGWNEGPGYWGAYMSFGMHFIVALREATGIDLSQRPFFANTPYYRLYLTPPHTQMAPFGDGTQWKPSRPGSLMYWFSTLNHDPTIRWYSEALNAGAGTGILATVLKDDSLHGEPPDSLPPARLFEGVGLACLRTDLTDGEEDVGFSMRSSPYGAVSHGHNDQNCFVLEAYGEALAVATGYYNNYGSPHHAGWTRQTKAKCGITHDGGQGQDRGWQAQGAITAFSHGADFDLVIGDATKAYGGRLTRAIREVVHVRPGLFVIRDDLAAEEPRTFEYWLHAIDEMEVDDGAGTVVITRPKASLTARFLHPEGLAISQTDQFDPAPIWPPDVEYDNNWHVTAALGDPAAEAEILSVLLPAKAGEEASLPTTRALATGSARGVEMTFADGATTLVGFALPGADGEAELGAIRTDARVFAVAYAADGAPRAWMHHGGEALRSGETKLGPAE